MNPVVFLLIAVLVAVVGSLVVVAINRKPSRPESAMTEFQREMRALAPRPPASTPGGGEDGDAEHIERAGPDPDES